MPNPLCPSPIDLRQAHGTLIAVPPRIHLLSLTAATMILTIMVAQPVLPLYLQGAGPPAGGSRTARRDHVPLHHRHRTGGDDHQPAPRPTGDDSAGIARRGGRAAVVCVRRDAAGMVSFPAALWRLPRAALAGALCGSRRRDTPRPARAGLRRVLALLRGRVARRTLDRRVDRRRG